MAQGWESTPFLLKNRIERIIFSAVQVFLLQRPDIQLISDMPCIEERNSIQDLYSLNQSKISSRICIFSIKTEKSKTRYNKCHLSCAQNHLQIKTNFLHLFCQCKSIALANICKVQLIVLKSLLKFSIFLISVERGIFLFVIIFFSSS